MFHEDATHPTLGTLAGPTHPDCMRHRCAFMVPLRLASRLLTQLALALAARLLTVPHSASSQCLLTTVPPHNSAS